MGYWLGEFRERFFAAWVAAGLTPPEPDPGAFGLPRPPPPHAVDPPALNADLPPAISADVVDSVYGFGRDFATICASLGAGDDADVDALTDWCGRFNLGISLFDYVCDERPDDLDALLALPAFAALDGRAPRPADESADGVLATLDGIALGVLEDLAGMVGPRTARARRAGLWRAIDSMFASQLALSGDGDVSPQAALEMMRVKSAEPFRVMAEYVARGAGAPPGRVRQLANFGRAAGDCFWLVDDAADVWRDLDQGASNYFLAMARSMDPTLDLHSPSPLLDARLGRLWRVADLAGSVSEPACATLAQSLHRLDPDAVDAASGRLATMLARWST